MKARSPATPNHPADPAATTETALSSELGRLQTLSLDDLRIRYRQLVRKTAPEHIPKWLLLRIVAYRLQASVLGDLDAETSKLLSGLGKSHEAERKARLRAEAEGKDWQKRPVPVVPSVSAKGRLLPGTELVREFGNTLHRVTVTDDGFRWNGKTYPSLSSVAQSITGTSWNGPAFFGLRNRRKPQKPDVEPAAVPEPAPAKPKRIRRRHGP